MNNYEIGKYFRNYSKENFGDDWKGCLSLSFKWKYKRFKYMEDWMDRLRLYMVGVVGLSCFDGVYVGEFNKDYSMGIHGLLYWESDLSDSMVRNKIYSWGINKGSCVIDEYKDEGFDFYISKFLYSGFESNWNLIGNRM